VAVNRGIGPVANVSKPYAVALAASGEGECKMPYVVQYAHKVRFNFCGGLSRGWAAKPAISAVEPSADAESSCVLGLFQGVVAPVLVFVLWSILTLGSAIVQSQVEESAKRVLVAVNRGIGPVANVSKPYAVALAFW
jgi:hypothetical protein